METLREVVESFTSKPEKTASSWKTGSISYGELYELIQRYASGISFFTEQGDRIALISGNRMEYFAISAAAYISGRITVPRGEVHEPEELEYVLNHSQSKIAIVEDEEILSKMDTIHKGSVKQIISLKNIKDRKDIIPVQELEMNNYNHIPDVNPETVVSIFYTSGTTGKPKGVMLTHGNIAQNVDAVLRRIYISEKKDKAISILPPWHTFEWTVEWALKQSFVEMYYSSIQSVQKDMVEQKPTIIASVPRLWEKVHERIINSIEEESTLKKHLFYRGLEASLKDKKGIPDYAAAYLYKKLVVPKIRERFGGKLNKAVSGGGPLNKEVDEFFRTISINILEGYGLTETSPIISGRSMEDNVLQTVGKPLDNIKVRIRDPETGELLSSDETGLIEVKGPSVMKGYYRDFKATQEVIRDGWFSTGDLGMLTEDGYLKVTGRYKDIIVTSSGENISPSKLEKELENSPYIEKGIVLSHDDKELGFLAVLDANRLKKFCDEQEVYYYDSIYETFKQPEIEKLLREEIKIYNNNFKTHEKIKHFYVLDQLQEGKELNHLLKLMRYKIPEIHEDKLKQMKPVYKQS